MNAMWEPGNLFQVTWDERPVRLLGADNIETFYDVFWPDFGWGLTSRRTSTYYRMQTAHFRNTATSIGREPLTVAERAMHRPDLPMRLFQNTSGDWLKPLAEWESIACDYEIEAPRLALIPFGPKGAPLRPVVVEAANGRSLAGMEILAGAHRAQSADCPDVEGVGLYRSGVSRGIPSYYLWGAIDRAGHAR